MVFFRSLIQLHMSLIRTRAIHNSEKLDLDRIITTEYKRNTKNADVSTADSQNPSPTKHRKKRQEPSFDARPILEEEQESLCSFDFGTVRLTSVNICHRYDPKKGPVYESMVSFYLP